MNIIDVLIIIVYIVLTLGVGIWISKKASKGLDSYFLGGNSIKWYYLGLSNGSGMFDVSGTAWMVGILFLYGAKSFMFMWIWPIWNQIFIMIFLAAWIRRSNIMTIQTLIKEIMQNIKNTRQARTHIMKACII